MTYLELYEKALNDLEHNKITLGEYEERIKPLKQESINVIKELEQIRKEIENDQEQMVNEKDFGKYYGMGWAIRIIDNHIAELKGETE